MKAQVLDVDYVFNGKPVVRMFCKDEAGRSACVFFEKFLPYIYVLKKGEGDELKKILENEGNIVKVEIVKKFLPMGYRTNPSDVYKITLLNPARTPELREKLEEMGYEVYEADIPFKNRFMIDNDISGMGWLNVEGKRTSTTSVLTQIKVTSDKISVASVEKNCDLSYLSLDIECVSEGGKIPDPQKDQIIMISLSFSRDYRGKRSMVLSLRRSRNSFGFGSEREMLERFVEIVKEYDPDIITGYNINNFDLPYIVKRMEVNGIKPLLGRCNNKQTIVKKFGTRYRVNIVGRVVVDAFELVKKDFAFKRYDLDSVCMELLGERKVGVRHSEIEKLWRSRDQRDFERLVEYSRKDAELALSLVLKLNLIDKYIALARVSGSLLQDVLNLGETARIENLLLREFGKNNFILPCKPDDRTVSKREKRKKAELKGGFVLEPKKGMHRNVLVLDFKSMYPSIIRTYNICPTTMVLGDGHGGDCIEAPSGARFVKENVRKGIVPRILERLMEERHKIKRMMKECREGERLRVMNAKQWALKIMANAFYGHFGYARSRLYSLDIANSVTSFGRETIKKTKKLIEEKYGYSVVYGDTDSVMVKVDEGSLDKLIETGSRLAREITEKLDGVLELEFEKVFKTFLPLTKKRYAALCVKKMGDEVKEEIETKGIETIRRDWCNLVSEMVERVLWIILKENDVGKAMEYFKRVLRDIESGNIDIDKLVITKSITKNIDSYKGVQPHVELAKKLRERSPADAPGIGDRIGFVIVKGTELVSKRAEDPVYVKEKGIPIDTRYYVENQLLPPLERILEAVGITKGDVLGRGRQVNILKFNGNNDKLEYEERVNFEFLVCRECGKRYGIPTLTGRCFCGGELLFSDSSNHVSKSGILCS